MHQGVIYYYVMIYTHLTKKLPFLRATVASGAKYTEKGVKIDRTKKSHYLIYYFHQETSSYIKVPYTV